VGVVEDLADLVAPCTLRVLFLSMGHDVPAQMHIARLRQAEFRGCDANPPRDLGHGFRSIV
jgi:hypothetical protein